MILKGGWLSASSVHSSKAPTPLAKKAIYIYNFLTLYKPYIPEATNCHVPGKIAGMEKRKRSRNPRITVVALEFLSLFAFWLILSGHYSPAYIFIGLFCSALVTWLTHDVIFYAKSGEASARYSSRVILSSLLRVITYIPWLLWEIIKANIQVAALILNPRLPVNPALIKFKTEHKLNVTRVTLANSITLTPGTITVYLRENTYVVHALTPKSASSIQNASMLNRSGAVFGEARQEYPTITWLKSAAEEED